VERRCLKPDDWLSRIRSSPHVRPSEGLSSTAVRRWHALLRAVAALNLALWLLSAIAAAQGHAALSAEADAACRLQLLLSAAYVFGCAFRSVLPVYDIPRIVLVDSRWSSVFVGRWVATVAELSFAAQWALILHQMATSTHSPFAEAASLAIVPLIVVAEGCSWYAVLTTTQSGHIVENSLWGLSAALLVGGVLAIGPHRLTALYPALYPMVLAWCVGGTGYVAFIGLFDVPMYWSRWLADQGATRQYLTIAQGLVDTWGRRVASHRWEDWKTEVLWMSLYFIVGPWSSVSIVYASIILGSQRH
jgi:hypothetical protein